MMMAFVQNNNGGGTSEWACEWGTRRIKLPWDDHYWNPEDGTYYKSTIPQYNSVNSSD